jgi:hypothetical protein
MDYMLDPHCCIACLLRVSLLQSNPGMYRNAPSSTQWPASMLPSPLGDHQLVTIAHAGAPGNTTGGGPAARQPSVQSPSAGMTLLTAPSSSGAIQVAGAATAAAGAAPAGGTGGGSKAAPPPSTTTPAAVPPSPCGPWVDLVPRLCGADGPLLSQVTEHTCYKGFIVGNVVHYLCA